MSVCTQTLIQRIPDRLLELIGSALTSPEGIAERHRKRAEHGNRIGETLARNIRRRTMHRLVHVIALRLPGLLVHGAKSGGWQHTQRACEHGGDVREHIAEQIVSNNHVELLRPTDKLHAECIGELMLKHDIGIFTLMQRCDHFIPQRRPSEHHVAALSDEVTLLRRLRAISKAIRPGLVRSHVLYRPAYSTARSSPFSKRDDFLRLAKVRRRIGRAHDHDVKTFDEITLQR